MLLTRQNLDNLEIANRLRFHHIDVVTWSPIEIKKIAYRPVAADFDQSDKILILSKNCAQKKLLDVLKNNYKKIICIGKSTAEKTQQLINNNVDYITESSSENLLKKLNDQHFKQVIILKGKNGRNLIEKTFTKKNTKVIKINLYERINTKIQKEKKEKVEKNVEIITATSVEILDNIDRQIQLNKNKVKLIVFSNRIKNKAKELKFKNITVVDKMNNEGLFKKIVEAHEKQS